MIELFGGPDRDRTDDLFHAMEARSQLRHRPTLRKDSIYSGVVRDIRQCCREPFGYLPVSKGYRVRKYPAIIAVAFSSANTPSTRVPEPVFVMCTTEVVS